MATAQMSRRGFLKSTGAVTAAAAMAGPGSLPQAVAKEHTMKFGLYGINMGPCSVNDAQLSYYPFAILGEAETEGRRTLVAGKLTAWPLASW
jgi:hypothetical protein